MTVNMWGYRENEKVIKKKNDNLLKTFSKLFIGE